MGEGKPQMPPEALEYFWFCFCLGLGLELHRHRHRHPRLRLRFHLGRITRVRVHESATESTRDGREREVR